MTGARIVVRGILASLVLALTAAGANGATITGLGAHFVPYGTNSHGVVVGDFSDPDALGAPIHAAAWINGALRLLPERAGVSASEAFAVSETGRIVGLEVNGGDVHAVYWDGVAGPFQIGPIVPGVDFSAASDIDAAGDIAGLTLGVTPNVHYLTGFYAPAAPSPVPSPFFGKLDSDRGSSKIGAITGDGRLLLGEVTGTISDDGYYLWSPLAPSAQGVKVDLTPYRSGFGFLAGSSTLLLIQNDLASDGSVLGYKQSGSVRTAYVRAPSGLETEVVGLTGHNAINSRHVVAGTIATGNPADPAHAATWDPQTHKVTDLNTLLPPKSGWLLVDALTIDDKGTVAGVAVHDNVDVGFVLSPGTRTVKGKAVRGLDGTHPGTPVRAVAGVLVTAKGTTAAGKAFTGSTTTDATGAYALDVPPGKYTVTLAKNHCVRGLKGCVGKRSVDVVAGDAVVDIVVESAELVLELKATPTRIDLKEVPDSVRAKGGAKVTLTVRVRNRGSVSALSVHLDPRLVISYADGNAEVPVVPLRQNGKPTAKELKLGTIKPKALSRAVTFHLLAKGDGTFDIEELATGAQAGGGSLRAIGKARVKVGSPLLEITARRGRSMPAGNNLLPAGKTFTVVVKMQNLSYRRSLDVEPFSADLTGNAQDGHLQPVGDPIPDPESANSCSPGQVYRLAPRSIVTVEAIVRTSASDAGSVDPKAKGGGTRATVEFSAPHVDVLSSDKQRIDHVLKGNELEFDPKKATFDVSIKDAAPATPPWSVPEAVAYFSQGALIGSKNFLTGTARGIFYDLPKLGIQGVAGIPGAYFQYVALESELWETVKDDPQLRQLYFTAVANQILLLAKNAPELADKFQKLAEGVNTSVGAHMTKLSNEWYAGDWRHALRDATASSTDLTLNLVPSIAVCALGKLAPIANATKLRFAAAFDAVTEQLAINLPQAAKVVDAAFALNKIVKVGYAFNNAQLRALYGLSVAEAEWLRNFAKANKLIIVARSRATEAVRWLAKGGVLKPEAIKLKNVDRIDAAYLGYLESDVGRVVIRKKLPTRKAVIAKLQKAGVQPKDPEWTQTFERLTAREKELTKVDKGYVKELESWVTDPATGEGEVTLNWNGADNVVDPAALTSTPVTYRFRITEQPKGSGNLIPEFKVNDVWRPVTGDIDFLALTRANGAPLLDKTRSAFYTAISNSVIGQMHPESATWVLKKAFNFKTKINEFIRGGTVLQFGPDGAARAVTFNEKLSYFKNKYDYRIHWNGGYTNTVPVR